MESNKKTNQKKFILLFISIILLLCGIFCGIIIKQKMHKDVINNVDSRNLLKNLINNDVCYVIGHKSPDTDTVCSAILLADYLKLYGINCEARVSGKLNNETKFVLDNYNLFTPEILEDASNKKIILVDHNEYSQSIDGMKDAEVVGIFDHHGIGNVETNGPIVSNTLNVGSTGTIIYNMYKLNDVNIDKKTAYLISSCILSDTLNLGGSTTTDIDRYALKDCVKIAGITNVEEFYNKMYEAALSYEGMSEKEIFLSDYKEYDMSGYKIGIACINSINKKDADEKIISMKKVMKDIYDTQGMDHLFVSIKNYANKESTLFGYGDGADEVLEKAYGSVEVVFENGASRKKDIVPKLKQVYEKLNNIEGEEKVESINIPCEVKFLLDSNIVLNEEMEINDKYKNIFSVTKEPKINSVVYVETDNNDFYKSGWINRLRIKGGKDEYNLTYKKRYNVENGDINKSIITANEDGFVDIEPELDWGYNNMTLSYSIETNIPYNNSNKISLPEKDMAIDYIKKNMPEIENSNGWGENLLDNADITTPIFYKKYSGILDNQKIDIEIWPIFDNSTGENEYITELSFKSKFDEAKLLKTNFTNFLDENSILIHKDSLKTQKVLNIK